MEIRWLGHSAFSLHHDGTTVLVDPFLTGNPKGVVSADEVEADAILLTHGHQDHGPEDAVAIAKRTGAAIQAIVEVAGELGAEGVTTIDTNIGGTATYDWGWCRMTPAWHTSTTPKGTVTTPAGLVISMGGIVIYHLGDTALFSDLSLPGRRDAIDVAIVPIGGHYTMDRHDAVTACEFVGAKTVIPCHYGTFPPIETDVEAFRADVEAAGHGTVVVLEPGGTWSP